MVDIRRYQQMVQEICRSLRVKRLYLVGSAVREDFDPERSDVDVLVEFEGREVLFDRYFALKAELERQFGARVDVIQEGAVRNPFVQRSLNQDKVKLYEA